MPFPSPDLKLVAVDMDGTLLDDDKRVPDALWPLLERMRERGILFVPASGRQLATLKQLFADHVSDMVFIAENGAFVVRGEQEISADAVDPAFAASVVRRVRALAAAGTDLGLVVCGKRSAYIERTDAAFRAQADLYYVALEAVDDLLAVDDQVLKLAIFDFGEIAPTAEALDDLAATHQVVVSGEHWIDVMNRGVSKGHALEGLQQALGVSRDQTAAFGDYLNDLEMLQAAGLSFAMANAHPVLREAARFEAPANTEAGVVSVLHRLLG